jgi:hypothetical protein
VAKPHEDASNQALHLSNGDRQQLDAALPVLSRLIRVALLDLGRLVIV